MKKTALITLIVAIVLIVLGLALSVYGIYLDRPHTYVRSYSGGFVSYHVSYVTASYGSGYVAEKLGHLLFSGGLVALVIAFIINGRNEKEDKITKEKEDEANRREARQARQDAFDATVHENGSGHDD